MSNGDTINRDKDTITLGQVLDKVAESMPETLAPEMAANDTAHLEQDAYCKLQEGFAAAAISALDSVFALCADTNIRNLPLKLSDEGKVGTLEHSLGDDRILSVTADFSVADPVSSVSSVTPVSSVSPVSRMSSAMVWVGEKGKGEEADPIGIQVLVQFGTVTFLEVRVMAAENPEVSAHVGFRSAALKVWVMATEKPKASTRVGFRLSARSSGDKGMAGEWTAHADLDSGYGAVRTGDWKIAQEPTSSQK